MKKYKSEIGFYYYLIAISFAAIFILSFIAVWKDSVTISETIIIYFVYILAASAYCFSILYPLFNTKYIIHHEKLIIRSGFYKKTILCNQIVEVIGEKSFGREPALSQERLYIKYKDGGRMYRIGISPKNKDDFLKHIGDLKWT